ncbi:MAG: RidA family protein [Cyclobacteriaceae bacterium]|tara:strand:- start:4766 stop:5239 length:474 start_codon:yes stop_codon:yes gene_type:complete
MKSDRRSIFKKIFMGTTGLFGLSAVSAASTKTEEDDEIVTNNVTYDDQVPLFSGSQTYGGLVYVAGKGAHFEGDITAHTKHVLDEIEKELEKAGSAMDRVLKVNVYLHDLNDYKAMNEAYRGRFGDNPPVRTTIAPYGGVPGNSLVEIDCIAALKKK